MPQVGFEPMTSMLEQAKTVHPLDRGASVMDMFHNVNNKTKKMFLKAVKNISKKKKRNKYSQLHI
jgi:hypothetical protein